MDINKIEDKGARAVAHFGRSILAGWLRGLRYAIENERRPGVSEFTDGTRIAYLDAMPRTRDALPALLKALEEDEKMLEGPAGFPGCPCGAVFGNGHCANPKCEGWKRHD